MKTVIEMAREARVTDAREYGESIPVECLERLVELARAEENEACALIADKAEPYKAADLIRKRRKA